MNLLVIENGYKTHCISGRIYLVGRSRKLACDTNLIFARHAIFPSRDKSKRAIAMLANFLPPKPFRKGPAAEFSGDSGYSFLGY